jgi:opacity protein-like surface antigen
VLPYLRFGPALARFETDYAIEGMRAAGTSRDDVVGLRGGLGLELPLGGHLSGRIEYLFTAYPDYDFAPAGAPDSFGNAEGMARIGLVYGFGPARTEETEAPAEFGGFYAGAQIGAGTLAADNVGPRPSASTQRFTLDVSRAATTVSGGVFAGWGTVVDGLYLGAEAEADLNAGDWNIERSAPGRIFSMTRRGGAGLSARVGWAWDDAFLLYARGGANWGRFDTDYTYRGTTTNRTDTLAGLSLGLGVEAPLSDSISIRAEYVQTRYHGFDLDFGDGIDSFDPRDGRFRFGLLTRF